VLDWDSEHFGFSIASVAASTLDEPTAARVDEWCAENEVRCLYFLADAEDAGTSIVAAEHGFRNVDMRMTVGLSLAMEPSVAGSDGVQVGEAAESERAYLRSLAASSYRGTSRFYFDGGFPPERCDAMYEAWVDRGFDDPERTIFVVRMDGGPAGYQVVGPREEDGVRRLELVAVDPGRRGSGVGRALISETMRVLRSEGAPRTWAILSARNIATVRLHERLGFLTEEAGVWHHKWYGAT
jgi:GNAT superfamily N-acetyltransferase